MKMIMSKSKPITPGAAIFYGGLIAGVLDATDGVVAYYFIGGLNPTQVLQFIASGFYGAAAFQKGLSGALVGLLAHFFIAFAVAAIYVGATRSLPMLNREAAMWGMIYGATVFIVMNFAVLSHTAFAKSPFSLPLLLNGVLAHALLVGLPIALAARRITNQSSLSTQALNYKAWAFRRNS
jgi:hypothetical protein